MAKNPTTNEVARGFLGHRHDNRFIFRFAMFIFISKCQKTFQDKSVADASPKAELKGHVIGRVNCTSSRGPSWGGAASPRSTLDRDSF
jgi:hypothetical protein